MYGMGLRLVILVCKVGTIILFYFCGSSFLFTHDVTS